MRFTLFFIASFFSLASYASDFVTIKATKNQPNAQGYGVVDYAYNISKYEITNEEYCCFLNAVASKEDPHALFNNLMQQHFMGGIIRTAVADGYHYSCKEGYSNRPIVCTTWMSVIRYINWLHYNAVNIQNNVSVEQWFKETEGDDTHGAYDTRTTPERHNKDARYWLPNRSEWEKAAYYDGSKWIEQQSTPNANCASPSAGWAVPYPHIAEVGLSKGINGTYDQCGNAAEWVETTANAEGWKFSMGGSAIRPVNYSYLGIVEGDVPTKAITTFGFRVCQSTDKTLLAKVVDLPIHVQNNTLGGGAIKFITDKNGTQYVNVGNIGNPGDRANQFRGSVYYEFAISRTELSNKEYCRFLNAVARQSDPYHLYHEEMQNGVTGGITRTKTSSGFQYQSKPNWEDRPVTYLAFYDLARYANWMHYGCPTTGESKLGTTEGNSTQGAYNTEDFEPVRSGQKTSYESFGKRNRGARFWIPSEDEWYKAAYYDPEKIGNRPYHDYPTRSSDAPTHEQANYMYDNTLCIGEPYFVVPVDSFQNAASFYGTLNQGGNVWEWLEDWQYGSIGCRGLRGGSWSYTAYGLNTCNTDPGGIDDRIYVYGGRLCMSLSDDGWQPVKKPFLTVFHQEILLMSPKKLLLAFGVALAAVLCLLTSVIILLFRKRK